ncbi:MAG: hypothetical protein NTW87_31160, partial [Planctomycetota bacterium]|nr:hypothetical protein [Planctomycetota bacterium]
IADLVGEGFRSAKKFTSEKFVDNDSGGDLQYALAADEAVKQEDRVFLTRMRLVYFMSRAFLPQPAATPKAGKRGKAPAAPAGPRAADGPPDKQGARPKKEKSLGDGAAVARRLPLEGQVVITAPQAVLDAVTNEGRATGGVTIEIFSKAQGGAAATAPGTAAQQPVAVLSTERLRWRSWGEPWSGATELALYSGGEQPGELDPVVTVRYVTTQADGASATVVVEGRGLVYETGTYDRPSPKEDEDGRTAGLSACERNRAIFRREIKMVTTAAAMAALMPFQAAEGPPAPNAAPRKAAKAAAPPPPSQTVLTCNGPAVLDMGAVPLAKESSGSTLEPVLLARRLEFYNEVQVVKVPVGAQALPGTETVPGRTDMACQQLCLQYAAGAVPGPAMLPEYAEAVGKVTMRGTSIPATAPGEPPPPPSPFNIACQRVFYDGSKDNTFLVGDESAPVVVQDVKGEASARQFCYHRATQVLMMGYTPTRPASDPLRAPANDPKRMVIKAAALPSSPPDKAG